jgi:hypothetical protein
MNLTSVTVSQTIAAPAEKVLDVWMDPKSPGGPWFGAERVILNPVVDGLFYFSGSTAVSVGDFRPCAWGNGWIF